MKMFEFCIVATGIDLNDRAVMDRLYEAGCDDATVSFQKGVAVFDFAREAESFFDALTSAIRDVTQGGAHVERIEPDTLVSLAEIAQRAGLSRSAATLYAQGRRGSGFPHPVVRVTSESPLWDWYEVASWLHQNGKVPRDVMLEARVLRHMNATITLPRVEEAASPVREYA